MISTVVDVIWTFFPPGTESCILSKGLNLTLDIYPQNCEKRCIASGVLLLFFLWMGAGWGGGRRSPQNSTLQIRPMLYSTTVRLYPVNLNQLTIDGWDDSIKWHHETLIIVSFV